MKEPVVICMGDVVIPPPVVREGSDGFELDGPIYGHWGYLVDYERCRTSAELLGWVCHLSEKTWVTGAHIQQLIELAAKRFPSHIKISR